MDQHDQSDENQHFFLTFLSKKTRNINKKLREIEVLEGQAEINSDQQKKIDLKHELLSQLKDFTEIKKMFDQAEKEALKQKKTQKKPETTLIHQDRHPVIKPTLNLVHLALIYQQNIHREEFQKNKAELDVISEFSQSVFGLHPDLNSKYHIYLNHCYHELDRYLNCNEDQAVPGFSYKAIHELVDKYVNSTLLESIQLNAPVQKQNEPLPEQTIPEEKPQPVQTVSVEVEKVIIEDQQKTEKEPETQVQPESPNQMLEDEKENEKPVVEDEHKTEKHVEDYGPEGKFEENLHENRGNRRGGRGKKHHRRGPRRKRNEEGFEAKEGYEEHNEEGGKEPEKDEEGFITVKHKYEKKEQVRGRRNPRGGHQNRERNERPLHEDEKEEEREPGSGKGKRGGGRRGSHQRSYGGHRMVIEYVKKE